MTEAKATAVPNARGQRKQRVGVVVSDKMQKTVVVELTTQRAHRVYKRVVQHRTLVKAHDEANQAHVGDRVRIAETRPLSRDKRWRVVAIVEQAR
jgi:small subunit ribosomal protein S17